MKKQTIKLLAVILLLIVVQFTNIFAQPTPQIEKSKAESKAESNIIGNVYQADYSKSKIIYPSDLANSVPKAIVVKGDERTKTLFDSLLLAKEFSKKNKQANVIIFDRQTKKYSLYELIIGENSPVAVELAETPFRKALNNKPSVPMTYESLKISPDYSLQILPAKLKSSEIADIVDAEGLSLIKKTNMQLMAGSKGIRLLFDSELEKSNFDEALKIYQWLENLNAKSNDLDVVKITRKTNLSKLYRANEKLKPFVEAEMEKWKYAEGDKTAVRGTKTPISTNNSPTDGDKTTPTIGKFAVGEIVDLQSDYVNTYWHKAEIVEIVGDKFKVRKLKQNYNKYTEIVSAQKIRLFTTPVKYEIGQKVESMDRGIWYKGEIIWAKDDFYGIRFEGTTNRSDKYDLTEEFMRPLNSSSTAQTKQEYSSPLWVEKFGISEQLLTKKMLAEANKDFEGCESKYNTLVPPTKLETSSSRAFADVVGGFGEDNKILLVYAIGNANLTRIKGTNVKTSRVGFTKPELLLKKQDNNETGSKISLNVIRLVFKGSDSYQIEAEPKNDDYTGIVKLVCNAPKSSATANLTVFTPIANGSSGGNSILSNAKESSVDANLAVKRAEIAFIIKSARDKKTDKDRIEPAKQILKFQNELVQYLTYAINGKELSESAKAKYRKILETEKANVRKYENLVKLTIEAAKYEQ